MSYTLPKVNALIRTDIIIHLQIQLGTEGIHGEVLRNTQIREFSNNTQNADYGPGED